MNAVGIRPGRVLIVGLGIGGMATAVRLHRLGWEPVIVEKAPCRRTGGYFIASLGTGLAAAARLGVLNDLPDRTPAPDSVMCDVDRTGKSRRSIALFDLPVRPKPRLMLRGDVEQALFVALPDDVEVRYSTVPTAIVQDPDGVYVTLHDAAGSDRTERFDLVVGADGLRSTVRSLVFGPPERFLYRLNHMIAAFVLPATPGGLAQGDGAMLFEPGRSLIVYPFADHPPTALFSYRSDDIDAEFGQPPVERIRTVYGPAPYGRLLGETIDAFEAAGSYLFDSVEQVRLDSWHRGRVVLVGDAAWCPTLYSGMGSSTAMAGAELLGTVLAEHLGSLDEALAEWERRLRPYTDFYQRMGEIGASGFTPSNRLGIELRRTFIAAQRWPVLGPAVRFGIRNSPMVRKRNIDIAAATQPPPATVSR